MQLKITGTTKIVELNGVPARVWVGRTGTGIPIHCFITRIAVADSEDQAEFERELASCEVPSEEIEAYPAKLVL